MSQSLSVVPPAELTPVPPAANPLPFDPRRVLGGVLARWYWLIAGALAGALLALGVGLFRSATRYEVSLRLLRRDVPIGFRAGEFGDAFKPRPINMATLVGTALSDNVLARVAGKSSPPVALGLLRLSVAAKELKNTDFVELTLSGYDSREDTVALANLWAQEIVQFSREMQTRESREVRVYVQQQIEQAEAEIRRLSVEMTDLAQKHGVVDVDRQIEAYLRTIGELDLRIETARSGLFATEKRLRSLETELAWLLPVRERITQMSRDLDAAIAAHGEGSRVVDDLRGQMAKLQAEAKRQQKNEFSPTAASASMMGSTLFMQLMEVRAQREALLRQQPELERLRDEARRGLAAMPEKSSKFSQLQQRRAALEAPRRMLTARLREAQHFEENAPGYLQVFSAASPGAVSVRQRWLKLTVFAAAGLIGGLFLGLGAAVGAELIDSRLRTAAEARRLYQSPVWTALGARDRKADWVLAVERLWLQWISTRGDVSAPLAVWCARPTAGEDLFWSTVASQADRLLGNMLIVDAGEVESTRLALLPIWKEGPVSGVRSLRVDPRCISLPEMQRVAARLEAVGHDTLVCVRFAGAVREPATSLARLCSPALVFVAADVARLDFWESHARLLRSAVKPPAGLVVAGESELFHAA